MEDENYRKLMDYAMRALSRRAHTVHEMGTKLKKRPQYTPALEQKVVMRLTELNLLNDDDFTRNLIENAVNFRFQGRRKIMYRLHQKGVPRHKANEIWGSMEIAERDVAMNALQKSKKRFEKIAAIQPKMLISKRAQFLAARGFSPAIVFQVAKEA